MIVTAIVNEMGRMGDYTVVSVVYAFSVLHENVRMHAKHPLRDSVFS